LINGVQGSIACGLGGVGQNTASRQVASGVMASWQAEGQPAGDGGVQLVGGYGCGEPGEQDQTEAAGRLQT
jgi:hypothetical protein